jgi:hypothetical protein
MPKYRVTLLQYKVKVIRASTLTIAQQRAEKLETGRWELRDIREEPEE